MEYKKYRAIISLFPTHAGGRQTNISKEYAPNAVFGLAFNNLANLWKSDHYQYVEADKGNVKNADIKVLLNEKIDPGGIDVVELLILEKRDEYIGKELLQIDSKFILREGGRIVGTGKII